MQGQGVHTHLVRVLEGSSHILHMATTHQERDHLLRLALLHAALLAVQANQSGNITLGKTIWP